MVYKFSCLLLRSGNLILLPFLHMHSISFLTLFFERSLQFFHPIFLFYLCLSYLFSSLNKVSHNVLLQEDFLGKGAKNPSFTRLPVYMFYDLSPGGTLAHIFSGMYKYKSEQGWRRFDLQSPSRKEANIQMCLK